MIPSKIRLLMVYNMTMFEKIIYKGFSESAIMDFRAVVDSERAKKFFFSFLCFLMIMVKKVEMLSLIS